MGDLILGVDFGSSKKRIRDDAVTAAMLASGLDTPPEVLALFYESIVDTSPCEMIPYHSPESDPA